VSKQDTHFFNTFSLVIGLLVVVALGLFALARGVASQTQEKQILVESQYLKGVSERVAPFARVAVAGQDNSALQIESTASALPAAAIPKDGTEAYETACKACHGAGIAGAPKAGDKAAWGPRIAQGKDTLYNHALHGFSGKTGVMPAKGGRADWPDDLIKQAVDHIVELEK
jgi:cytochrome c5